MPKKTFKGGAHPPEFKNLTESLAIEVLPAPERVFVPIVQHLGAPGKPLVIKKDKVKLGQKLTDPGGFVSVPCHSPVSGTVKKIDMFPHPFGRMIEAIEIENDGEDSPEHDMSVEDGYLNLDPKIMIQRIREGGLAGMGGAAFPTHVKLSPPADKPIKTLIINGAECEPFLTADHRLMLEYGKEIFKGIAIIQRILKPEQTYIGIENNKPDAIAKMREISRDYPGIKVAAMQVKYPQGAEKQLINALTGREVPSGGLPMDVNCLVHNVGTTLAIYQAVAMNKPLIERVVTVTGDGVVSPKNVTARIGTLFSELVAFAGGYTDGAAKLIMGGPMMGMAQHTDQIPIIKGTSGILILSKKSAALPKPKPCIGCSRCLEVCPMHLTPTLLATLVEYNRTEDSIKQGILDCMECGSCSYICPTKRNLVHILKLGKMNAMELKRKEKEAA
ncbi:MAG: electron transport complex subunit RsxC [candidate division Zixibacteria bacterium]|nr:electron transport complex subunit RsxC [Candidatus Tariuqbacter arcticus]